MRLHQSCVVAKRVPDQSVRRNQLTVQAPRVRETAKVERILAERKLELLKRAKERKLEEERLRLDNEIAQAEDEADLARTKDLLFDNYEETLSEKADKREDTLKEVGIKKLKPERGDVKEMFAASKVTRPHRDGGEYFNPPPLTSNVVKERLYDESGTSSRRRINGNLHTSPTTQDRPFLHLCDLTPTPICSHVSPARSTSGDVERTPHYSQRHTPVPSDMYHTQRHVPPLAPPTKLTNLPGEPILTKLTSCINSIVTRTNLPPLEIIKFNGDPCAYYRFKSRFYEMVDSQGLTESQKMTRLLQFLDGKAKSAVSGFEGIPGGLTKAMKVLENRFGQPHVVTKACVDAMIEGPNLSTSDRRGLRDFADRCRTLYETLSAINALAEMNMSNMASVCGKLPMSHQVRWREEAQRIREHGRNPSFLDLVVFLEKRADVVNDPVFGFIGETNRLTRCSYNNAR